MFNNVGPAEILVLAVLGLVIFGPERLPGIFRDVVGLVRQLRTMARGAAEDLKSELGPEMADLNLRSLHPRTFLEDALRDDPEPVSEDIAATPVGRPSPAPLALTERPPYDPDAT